MSFCSGRSAQILLGALILGLVATGAWIGWRRTELHRAERNLFQHSRVLDAFRDETPLPSPQNVERTNQVVETLTAEAFDLRRQILGDAVENVSVQDSTVERTDLFFELARFVDQMRHRCGELGITLRESEYFGFASYAEAGPEKEFVRSVARQRRVVEGLLGELFQAKPSRFDGLRRERPMSSAQGEKSAEKRPIAIASQSREGAPSDYFTLDSAMSLRRSGNVDTLAFRLSFAGETSVLRTFLNRLAGAQEPWWVRQVEVMVDPASERSSLAPSRPAGPAAEGDEQAEPAIDRGISLFVVTVERIEKIGPRRAMSSHE